MKDLTGITRPNKDVTGGYVIPPRFGIEEII